MLSVLFAVLVALQADPFIQFISHQYDAEQGLPEQRIERVWKHQGAVYVRAGALYYRLSDDTWQKITDPPEALLADRRSKPDLEFPDRYYLGQPLPDPDAVPAVEAVDAAGHRWIGTSHGLFITTGDDYLLPIAPEPGGLPYDDVTALALDDQTGNVWVGFSEGAALLHKGKWRYFWGRQWLPGNHVFDIAIDGEGGAWLATDGGVAHIEARPMTLEEKARHYERINALRHNRYGFTADCSLSDPEDLSTCTHIATDNDGLWTALTVAAESFRYAVTGAEAAEQLARESMQAMLELVYKTPGTGFPARAIAKIDEKNVVLSGTLEEDWRPSPEEGWRYKTDTSSDEIVGHYFAWYVYSTLVADAEEKKEIVRVCRAVTDRILGDDLLLLRPDGQRTTWGVWAPSYLNDDPTWWQERGLNSMEALTMLRVAMHLVGEARYAGVYERLIQEEHYLLNAAPGRVTDPPQVINHSDDELWFLSYYPIGMLEKDPARRRLIVLSVTNSWKTIRPEHSPLYNFIYGAITGNPTDVEAAVRTLERWPWDLRLWDFQNSHRTDLVPAVYHNRKGEAIATTSLPPDERSGMRWNQDPYQMDGGDGGHEEAEGAAFLLPYWMGRYHGYIE